MSHPKSTPRCSCNRNFCAVHGDVGVLGGGCKCSLFRGSTGFPSGAGSDWYDTGARDALWDDQSVGVNTQSAADSCKMTSLDTGPVRWPWAKGTITLALSRHLFSYADGVCQL